MDLKMRPPSGGGVARRLLVERLRLHGHLKAAAVARENAELYRRLLPVKAERGRAEKDGYVTRRTLGGGLQSVPTPTAREQCGGYARRQCIPLQQR